MIQDILDTINIYRRGGLPDSEFCIFQEFMFIKKMIGKESYRKSVKKSGDLVESIKFQYDGPCYIEIKRDEEEKIIVCMYKSFMYGEAPYYEGYDESFRFDINDETFHYIIRCISHEYEENNYILSFETFDHIKDVLEEDKKESYLYKWDLPLKYDFIELRKFNEKDKIKKNI